jgi:signal peptidase
LEVGNIIIFNSNTAHPIIHRIINVSQINGQTVFATKGDNNPDQLYLEKQIPKDAIIGKAIFRVPKLGWLKLFFVTILGGS